jgi:hypothetical protein
MLDPMTVGSLSRKRESIPRLVCLMITPDPTSHESTANHTSPTVSSMKWIRFKSLPHAETRDYKLEVESLGVVGVGVGLTPPRRPRTAAPGKQFSPGLARSPVPAHGRRGSPLR